jgi:hypothetical protein
MASLAEYFAANRYHGKWQIGDRVSGKWHKIPFIGSVGNDTVINELIGPQVSIHLDLPIRLTGQIYNVIILTGKDIKSLKKLIEHN